MHLVHISSSDPSALLNSKYLAEISPVTIRLNSLGDLVGLAFRIVRRNYRLYFGALMLPSCFAALGSALAQYSFKTWVSIAAESKLAVAPFALHMSVAFLGMLIWFFGFWELSIRSSALVRLTFGLESSFSESYRILRKRAGTVFLAYNLAVVPPLILMVVWSTVSVLLSPLVPREGMAHWVLGGATYGFIGFCLTVSLAFSLLFAALLIAVAAIEPVDIRAALGKSMEFLKARTLRGGSFICLFTAALVATYLAMASPIILISLIDSTVHGGKEVFCQSVFFRMLAALFDVVLNVILFAVGYTGDALYYRDVKLRVEGADLSGRLEELSAL